MMRLLTVPYDSGHRDQRMGSGPLRLMECGALDRLRGVGQDVDGVVIEPASAWRAEVQTAFELNRALSRQVREAIGEGRFPLVLAGNCNSALGTVAGLLETNPDADGADVGVLWLDGHGDFHTAETTLSGFFDGMSLAALTGRCWRRLSATIPNFSPIPERRAILVGASDTEVEEREALEHSSIAWLTPQAIRSEGAEDASLPAFDALAADGVSRLYVHIDLDVHHPSEGRTNSYDVAEGLAAAAVRDLVRIAARRFDVAAVTLTAYDPSADRDGRMQQVALDLIETVGGLAAASRSGAIVPGAPA